MILPQLLQTH